MAKAKYKTDEDFKKAKEKLNGTVDLRKRKDGRNIAAKHPIRKKKRKWRGCLKGATSTIL